MISSFLIHLKSYVLYKKGQRPWFLKIKVRCKTLKCLFENSILTLIVTKCFEPTNFARMTLIAWHIFFIFLFCFHLYFQKFSYITKWNELFLYDISRYSIKGNGKCYISHDLIENLKKEKMCFWIYNVVYRGRIDFGFWCKHIQRDEFEL